MLKDPVTMLRGLSWGAPGSLNGKPGVWELVVDPSTGTIVRYLFNGDE